MASTLEALFDPLPAPGDYSVGGGAREALVNRLQGATPGRHSEMAEKGPTFLSIFFPGFGTGPYYWEIDSICPGIDWTGFSVAVLCEAMYRLTRELRPQLRIGSIQAAVGSHNEAVQASAVAWYGYVFSLCFAPFAAPFSSLSESQRPQVAAEYNRALTSPTWVTMKEQEYADGQWSDRESELFHHWLKLSLLGLSDAEIDTTIGELAQQGLPVQGVEAGAWRRYMGWAGGPFALGAADVEAEARRGILEEVCIPAEEFFSCMAEENSFEFTAGGQPGEGYRDTHGGSCFAGEAQVPLPDGGRVRIDAVRAGQTVATPRGPRRVLMVAEPARGERPLCSLPGFDFRFTASHPFLHGEGAGGARLAAVDPVRLTAAVATAADGGAAPLRRGTPLLAWDREGVGEIEAGPVSTAVPPKGSAETLYDLVLEDFGPYPVGDADRLLLAGPELPDPAAAGYATLVVTRCLAAAAPAIRAALAGADAGAVAPLLAAAARRCFAGLPEEAIAAVQREGERPAPGGDVDPLEAARRFTALFGDETGAYDRVMGQALEWTSGRFGDELRAAVEMGWRHFGPCPEPSLLAISLHDAHARPPTRFSSSTPGLQIALDGDEQRLGGRSRRPASPFAWPIDEVAYLDWHPAEPPHHPTLRIGLRADAGDLSGELPLHPRLVARRGTFRIPLEDERREEHGWVFLDLRRLGDDEARRERAAMERWDEGARADFAQRLGDEMGRAVSDRFGRTPR